MSISWKLQAFFIKNENILDKSKVALADNLKELRLSRGFSQEELADYLGFVSNKTISNWEKGVSKPSLETILEICSKLEISLDELILDKSSSLPPPPSFATLEDERAAYETLGQIKENLIRLARELEEVEKRREILLGEIRLNELAVLGLKASGEADEAAKAGH